MAPTVDAPGDQRGTQRVGERKAVSTHPAVYLIINLGPFLSRAGGLSSVRAWAGSAATTGGKGPAV